MTTAAERAKTQPTLPRSGELVLKLPARRIRRRSIVLGAVLLLVTLMAFATQIGQGSYAMSPFKVIEVLLGGGEQLERTVVLEWRLARGVAALVIGAALGTAGAITQSIARNPLASPDLLGLSMGCSAAAVAVIVLAPAPLILAGVDVTVTLAALAGGVITAMLVALLAWRDSLDTMRLVLVGVGVNALAGAIVTGLLVSGNQHQASTAIQWLAGSVNGMEWNRVLPLLVLVSLALALLVTAAFDLEAMQLGQSVARSLGVAHPRSLITLWAAAIILTAATVAAAGPVGFVALAAPQVARLVFQASQPPVFGSALVGGTLVLLADVAGGSDFPVGLVTAAIGAPFLIGVLVRSARKVTV